MSEEVPNSPIRTLAEDISNYIPVPSPALPVKSQAAAPLESFFFVGNHNPYFNAVTRLINAQPGYRGGYRRVQIDLHTSQNLPNFTTLYNLTRTLGSVCRRIILRLLNVQRNFDPSFPARKYNEFENVIFRQDSPIRVPSYYLQQLVENIDSEFAHFTTEFLLLARPVHDIRYERDIFCVGQRRVVILQIRSDIPRVQDSWRVNLQVSAQEITYGRQSTAWNLMSRAKLYIERLALIIAEEEEFLQGGPLAELDLGEDEEDEDALN